MFSLCKQQWTLAQVVYISTIECPYVASTIMSVLQFCGIQMRPMLFTDDDVADNDTIANWLAAIKDKSRSKSTRSKDACHLDVVAYHTNVSHLH